MNCRGPQQPRTDILHGSACANKLTILSNGWSGWHAVGKQESGIYVE